MQDVMDSALGEVLESSGLAGVSVGWIVQVTVNGRPLVDFPGNALGPVEARSVVTTQPASVTDNGADLKVLLFFENGDPRRPIILGFVCDALVTPPVEQTATIARDGDWATKVDGKRLVFNAQEEIVLRCGKSSVTLLKNGKIVLKGIDIVSRALETHKIKGANVRIN